MQYLKKSIRDNIMKSAVEEFKTYGFADASIRNIANNANISLGNIYRYFDNKEALYFSIVNPVMEEVKRYIDTEFTNPDVDLTQASEKILNYLMENSDAFMAIRKGSSFHYNKFMDNLVDATADKINKMLQDHNGRINGNIVSPDFARIVASGFIHGVFQILRTDSPFENKKKTIKEVILFYFQNLNERMK